MSKWIKIEKKLPNDDRQVLALSGKCAYLASYREGQWWITYSMKLGDVSRWMDLPSEPKDLEYWLNRIRGWWKLQRTNAEDTAEWLKGWTSSKAQLDRKVIFYKDSSGKLMAGMPENIPSPRGYQKIVCNSAIEAERYSAIQRQQERVEHGRAMAERGAIEGQFQSEWRSEAHHLMSNAKDNKNREFMRRALERNESHSDPTKYERESYLHSEAYESKR